MQLEQLGGGRLAVEPAAITAIYENLKGNPCIVVGQVQFVLQATTFEELRTALENLPAI